MAEPDVIHITDAYDEQTYIGRDIPCDMMLDELDKIRDKLAYSSDEDEYMLDSIEFRWVSG